ncbi:MAG TPA: Ig-like domain repeat protein [Acidobacteriaceae bacterium]
MIRLRSDFAVLLITSALWLGGCGGAGSSSGSSTPPAASATAIILAASPNPAAEGATVALTATISSGGGIPTGSITFLDGSTILGTATIATGGTATYALTSFAAGTSHTLTASYAGTSSFAASTSSPVVLTIASAPPPSSINAHASFTFNTPNQVISGFGAAEAFYLNYLDQHPNKSAIYKALFDPSTGLGLTYLRIQNLYRGSSASGFDVDTPLVVNAANAAHGTPLTLLMSSWSPPASLKSNSSTSGCISSGGVCTGTPGTLALANGSYDYAGFANYWLNSLSAYAAQGVVPAYISIQNEPDFTATYDGCRFNPTEATYNGTNYASYASAFDAVYQKLQTISAPPKMVGPETLSSSTSFLNIAAQIKPSQISAYAHHLYNVSYNSSNPDANIAPLTTLNQAYPTAAKFETEYYAAPGFNTAWNIHNALTYANDNAYIYWQATWPSTLSNGQAVDQQGLIYVDSPFSLSSWAFTSGWSYNDAYYALKHFSYYVRPGYVRYNAAVDNTDERVSVYRSADAKTTVIVALNVSSTATDGLLLSLSNIGYASSVVYRSSFSSPIATGERWANLGSYNSSGIVLPPLSVVTIVLTN